LRPAATSYAQTQEISQQTSGPLIVPATLNPTLEPTSVSTAIPTTIPTTIPTSTEVPATVLEPTQDTRLEVGQTWTHDGVSLTLDNAVLTLKSGNWSPASLGVSFIFKNDLSNDLFFALGRSDFYYTDNLGNIGDSGGWGWPCYGDTWNVNVSAGGTLKTIDCEHPGTNGVSNDLYDRLIWFQVDITNQKIIEVTITVREFSRITDAKWRIPIPH
jgi:hypothetical protein